MTSIIPARMSQSTQVGTDEFMHYSEQSKATQNSFVCHVSKSNTPSSRSSYTNSTDNSCGSDIVMRPTINFSHPTVSSSNGSVSTRSSISYESSASSSSSAVSKPVRSSMKSSLKSPITAESSLDRRPSPATVRFADIESMYLSYGRSPRTHEYPNTTSSKVPNPLLQRQHHHAWSNRSSRPVTSKPSQNLDVLTIPPRPNGPLSVPKRISTRTSKQRASDNPLTLGYPHVPDYRWSKIPPPTPSSPEALTTGSRVASFQSTSSTFSVQSAPAVLSNPINAGWQGGQYNPLQHYVPCLYIACSAHYTTAQTGPTYYSSQGPYTLSRLHGYCHHHASKELKDANSTCKRQWERSRQHAGRKTLGLIATEFDIFLEHFREDRRLQGAQLQREQKQRVLGASSVSSSTLLNNKEKAPENRDWNWRYTPRPCTQSGCTASHYSPYANHLFSFYASPQASTFKPLRTLCPTCAKAEVDAFQQSITDKWSSRCGWNEDEWGDWFDNMVKDRAMEQEFWEKAQERVVREKGPVRRVARVEDDVEVQTDVGKKGRQSIFRKLFSGMTT